MEIATLEHSKIAASSHKPKARRTLPGMQTAAGAIFVGYTKAAIVPVATEFMFVRELAWRVIDPRYPVGTSLGYHVGTAEVAEVYQAQAASLIGNFIVLSPI